ncbi:MAG: class I SAM-dependent methyltransferase [Actinomycetota bacterium]|nr:class I SAM-dependent methyltransferase [Actinomycetota bacterium]
MSGDPLVGDGPVQPVLRIDQVPVFCNALFPTASEAKAAPCGDIDLAYIPSTGYLYNRAFDPELTAYSPQYENSLHFSPRFQEFAKTLTDRLVSRYDLRGKRIVEIGAGSGNFMAMLCEAGGNTGVGYDPSHDPARAPESDAISIVAEMYPTDREIDADLVICQHVLEHVPDPAGLVEGVRASMGGRDDIAVYFEVPDATYMVEQLAVWDLIYEHYSYFAAPTLQWTFERAGFEVVEIDRAFGDQYLWIEAKPGATGGDATIDAAALAKLGELVGRFEEHFSTLRTTWTRKLDAMVGEGPTAIWGAGSKGVTFLNLIEAGADVSHVVDINPHKHGLHVPGTGQPVVGPEAAVEAGVKNVVIMNPLYEAEITQSLRDLGSDATVTSM